MRKTLLFYLLISIVVNAKTYTDTITDFTIVKVRDGDTFVINIPNIPDVFGHEIAIRIRGIDTPEKSDKRNEIKAIAYKATEELTKLLNNAKKIELYDLERDKYFRVLARVSVDGIDVGDYMIKKGLAKKYAGGKKVW